MNNQLVMAILNRSKSAEEDIEAMLEIDVDELEEAMAGLDSFNLEELLRLMGIDSEPHEENTEDAPTETPTVRKEETPTVRKHVVVSERRPSKKSDQHGRFQDDILWRLQKQLKETKAAYTPYTYGRNGLTVEEHADYDDNEMSCSNLSLGMDSSRY
ncbi:hypothetical protein SEMRO_416_G138600.1 [Seminavis robusta]|uniref:Uncharacterized protein n=1 Tax=Seminavis robusta TaxID=568900 RepID=A0A9N8E039_9STRA|nr:hypothetical protein SEMRO_416_G138600.1 [Seminavis robusta]|eukprot:Sro416_g138600.1 n/a (157) ;mRNA; f:28728-29198